MRFALVSALAVALLLPAGAAAQNPWLSERVLNIAHQGGEDEFPSNTLSDDGESPATWRRLIDWCVDGVMTARPTTFEKVLRRHPAPEACG